MAVLPIGMASRCSLLLAFAAVVFTAACVALLVFELGRIGLASQSGTNSSSRGRVLGGIDAIVLLSPSIGLFIGSFLAERSLVLSGIYVMVIFAICLMIALVNPELAHPEFADEETA